jgi:hypothetical protein
MHRLRPTHTVRTFKSRSDKENDMSRTILTLAMALVLTMGCAHTVGAQEGSGKVAEPPKIKKLGTLECDMVETTPIVFKGKLYRLEYVRAKYYKPNTTGASYFRFIDVASDKATNSFAPDYHLGSAFVDNDTVYVYGVPKWGGDRVHVFWSKDLKTWKDQSALELPRWTTYNSSVTKAKDRYVLAIEIGAPPEVVGKRFTIYFAESTDLLNWKLLPKECVYSKEFYSACPTMAYLDDDFFYMVYLHAYKGYYAPSIVRSKDLIAWEPSPFNPIMVHDDEDRKVANPKMSAEHQKRIAEAKNLNNSDVDFCEFKGKLVIMYSWGNQQGIEHLAEAEYHGSEEEFLKGFFPESK